MKRHPAGAMATHRQRVLRRLIGRLREAQRNLDQDRQNITESRVLWNKIRRCSMYNHDWGIQRNLRHLETLLERFNHEDDYTRLQRWRNNMEHDKAAYRWLRHRSVPMCNAVKKTKDSVPSHSTQDSLRILREFWADIWNRRQISWDDIWDDLGVDFCFGIPWLVNYAS